MVRDVIIIITEESALNGKAIVGWTFASLVEYRMGFATVQEPNSGGVSGRSYIQAPVLKSFDNWLRTLALCVCMAIGG